MPEKVTSVLHWIYHIDGTVETNCPSSPKPPQSPSTEHRLYDYDKLIAESGWPYSQWWELWKRIHPEWALYHEAPEKVELPPPAPKPKPAFKPLTCKRCSHEWTPRSKEPPVSCPKCHSPYWNRERMKK